MFNDIICLTRKRACEFLRSFGYVPVISADGKEVGILLENDLLYGGHEFFMVWNGLAPDNLLGSFKFMVFDAVCDYSDIFQLEPRKFVLRSLRKIRYLKKNEDPRDIAAGIAKELNGYRVKRHNTEIDLALGALEG